MVRRLLAVQCKMKIYVSLGLLLLCVCLSAGPAALHCRREKGVDLLADRSGMRWRGDVRMHIVCLRGGGDPEGQEWRHGMREETAVLQVCGGGGGGEDSLDERSSSSVWSLNDYEESLDRNAEMKLAAGDNTPHPHDLNWNMTYYNDRNIDMTEGMFDDTDYERMSWNAYCETRDQMLKTAGIYESFFLDDGVPPPGTGPYPDPEPVPNATHPTNPTNPLQVSGGSPSVPLLEEGTLSAKTHYDAQSMTSIVPNCTSSANTDMIQSLFGRCDPVLFPVRNMTLEHWGKQWSTLDVCSHMYLYL